MTLRAPCLLVLLAETCSLSQNWWVARGMRQSHKTDAVGHVTAGAGSALTLGDVPRGATGRRGGRLECALLLAAGAFHTQVHSGTRGCASPFCLPSFSMLRQASQNGALDAPDAFAAAALAALIDAAR